MLATHADALRNLAAKRRTAIARISDAQLVADIGVAALPSDIVKAARSLVP